MHHVCDAVDRMGDTRVRFKCAKAVRLCAARGLHVRFGTKPILVRDLRDLWFNFFQKHENWHTCPQ